MAFDAKVVCDVAVVETRWGVLDKGITAWPKHAIRFRPFSRGQDVAVCGNYFCLSARLLPSIDGSTVLHIFTEFDIWIL